MVINTLQDMNKNTLLTVTYWLFAYVACFYVFEMCHRAARGIELGVAYRNKKRFVLDTYLFLQSMSLSWHAKHHSGNVISRVNKASDALFAFGQSIYNYITAIIQFAMAAVVLWLISPFISVVSILAGCLLVIVTRMFYNKTVPEYRKLNEGFHEIAGTMQDGVSNITTIIILRLGKYVYKDLEKKFDSNYCHMKTENKYTQYKCHFNSLIEILLNVGLIFYYILTATQSGKLIMLGSVTAIFQYLAQIMNAFGFYAADYENCIHWRADLEAVDIILADEKEVNAVKDVNTVKDVHAVKDIHAVLVDSLNSDWKNIDIKSVNFQFENSKTALHNISVVLKRRKKIAFVGESGSGKSTLLKIIRGIYPVKDCIVRIDGNNQDRKLSALAGITTLIPQEPEMFDHTILYNIAMGLESTEEEVEQAIYLSGLDEVLNKLPNGIYSQVSEDGVNLSGGEKQRLALARGIFSMKDSSIVLLDEPTSSLDAETELRVYERMFRQFSDRCIVSVLHRLHLLHLFDYIYVFRDGRIVEEGTIEQLKAENGYFNELWNQYMQIAE
jgi:ABC-type multidrug transport system fused ATPase/permease subunit